MLLWPWSPEAGIDPVDWAIQPKVGIANDSWHSGQQNAFRADAMESGGGHPSLSLTNKLNRDNHEDAHLF
jgi:hypothetical protein